MQRAFLDCFAPLRPRFSEGCARLALGGASANYDERTTELEAFARPLWGAAPFTRGGGNFAHWDLYRKGIASGTDPRHPEYWGDIGHRDQRMVELAAIGFAMRLVPEAVWEPLDRLQRRNLADYLQTARRQEYHENNWKFFRILTDLGLRRCGIRLEDGLVSDYLDELEGFYIDDGWYRDGNTRQMDHYIPFAMHFYGLIYSTLAEGDDARRERFLSRARRFAEDYRHLFDSDGGVVAFGRSLTYRFACASFWGALAFAGLEALPWGEIKGHYLRHLRWWSRRPISDRDGILSIGYGYPNLFLSESYNAGGSPYWAFKAFMPLALPADHPFWTAGESEPEPRPTTVSLRHPGFVAMGMPGHVVALSSGQSNLRMRAGTEKYAKFAYSSRYAFSVEVDERGFAQGAFDGALALSDDGRHYRVRETNDRAKLARDSLYSRWHPWADISVETWLIASNPWHVRIHRIDTPRPLQAIEGGFGIVRNEPDLPRNLSGEGQAIAINAWDVSGIVDLGPQKREGIVHTALSNTHLLFPRSQVPQLRGSLTAGRHVLAAAVVAGPAGTVSEADFGQPPLLPDLAELEAMFEREGVDVSAIHAPG